MSAGVRLLLVDDNARHLDLIGAMLEPNGYETASAHTAEEALQIVRRDPADLGITDINLLGMSGLQLVRRHLVKPAEGARLRAEVERLLRSF